MEPWIKSWLEEKAASRLEDGKAIDIEDFGELALNVPFAVWHPLDDLHEAPRVVAVDATHIRDLRGGLLRDETDGGARRRERAFRFEHAHEPCAFRDCVAQLHRDEDRRERGHTAKNVV